MNKQFAIHSIVTIGSVLSLLAASSAALAEVRLSNSTSQFEVRRLIKGQSSECDAAESIFWDDWSKTTANQREKAGNTLLRCLNLSLNKSMLSDSDGVEAEILYHQGLSASIKLDNKVHSASREFRGISFGVGVGASLSNDDIISTAVLDANNVIRATKDETLQPRVILESHYYGFCRLKSCNEGKLGIGPYFGIVAKDDKLISAISAGVMFGWKDAQSDDNDGFSIGFGAILDSDVQSLASGFNDGESLPEGESAIRFKTESRLAAILFFTRTF